ncbi:MAG: uncharacterized protein QOF14_1103 [Hyphomicrobiales bacterium]|nr:uncharacterized protein [Hyphomicrobiales bacterium]
MSAPAARPTTGLRDDPKLARIADALRETFGARLVSALLFGSRARGDHKRDSDYDVAVFLDGYEPTRDHDILDTVRGRLGESVYTLQFWPLAKDGLAARNTLMFNIRNEGVPLPGLAWPPVIAPPIVPDEGPMKPETRQLLTKADLGLEKAATILRAGVADSAGREAYIAALYAARALIFEERNVAPKTHDGSKTLFNDIAVRTHRLPEHLNTVLTDGYDIKFIVDYSADIIEPKDPVAYVGRAVEFVAAVKRLIDTKA